MSLPTNIDASYPDRDPGDKAHQRHHDIVHDSVNRLPAQLAAIVAADAWQTADPLTWAAGTTYQPRTVVVDDGGMYLATAANTGQKPTAGGPWVALPTAVDAEHRASTAEQFAATEAANKATYPTVVNVRGYGALGDGATNDTTAILAALAAAGIAGTVYFPAGNYRIDGALTPLDGQTISGAGQFGTPTPRTM
jgi:hypothetical protein